MATTNPIVKLKRGNYSALQSTPPIDGTLYFTLNFSVAGSTAQADTTGRNIFFVDVTSDNDTITYRYPLDAYRAFSADIADVSSTTEAFTSPAIFKIVNNDGTGGDGNEAYLNGAQSTVTLKLPATIKSDITGTAAMALAYSGGAKGSASNPIYIDSDGHPLPCNDILNVDITGTARYADELSSPIFLRIQDVGTGNERHESDLTAQVNVTTGSTPSYITLPSTITASLHGIADSAFKLVNDDGAKTSITTTQNKAVYFSNGVPVVITGTLQHDISGHAASASIADAFSTSAGNASTPIYLDASGVPREITSIDVNKLGDQIIPMKNLPKGVQERLFITKRADNNNAATDEIAISRFIASKANTNDPVEAGDVILIHDNGDAMYYIYEKDGELVPAVFTSGLASNSAHASESVKLDHDVVITIKDHTAAHSGTQLQTDFSSGEAILKLPSTITATLDGNATTASALKLTQAVGSIYEPVYFDSTGVPKVCTGPLHLMVDSAIALSTTIKINDTDFDGTQSITTAKWGTARTVTISDNSGSNTQANEGINGGANFTLKLPATIKATLKGNADTATTASKTQAALSFEASSITGQNIQIGSSFNGSGVDQIWSLSPDHLFPVYTAIEQRDTPLAAGVWTDVPTTTPVMATGTYIIQVTTDSTSSFKNELFSGIMSYSSATCTGSDTDEVLLHSAGVDLNGHRIFVRLKRNANKTATIRYCSDTSLPVNTTLTFKFRRML